MGPILPASLKLGIHQVPPEGMPCHTDFKRLSYNGEDSIVLASPRTGRTHQIRVHLKHLGFPIMNDPLYSCSEYDASLSDVDIAILKKKLIDEKSTGFCPDCEQ
ncbi:RNA pseudouridylate synthase domain containing protein 2, partial [Coelomomyces lativittatus]